MKYLIIIPTYNEKKSIHLLINNILKYENVDILVIDDGSIDQTTQIAEKAGGKVIKHRTNLGKGMALRTGFDYISLSHALTSTIRRSV